MAIVAPFQAMHYEATRVLPELLAPPYDVIGTREHRQLCGMHRHNIIHLTLGSSLSRRSYRGIGQKLRRWIQDGVLIQDGRKSFYAYCQEYNYSGRHLKFWGLVGLLKLEPIGTGHIFPHEAVMPDPVDDRLKIMESSHANLEPIMTLYHQPSDPMELLYAGLESVPPLLDAQLPNHTRHRIWRLPLKRTHARIRRALKRMRLFVADGHHRYHAAWMFRQRRRRLPGAQWVLSLLANTEQQGLRIEPIHRSIVSSTVIPAGFVLSLERFGRLERIGRRAGNQLMDPGRNALGFYSHDAGAYILHLTPPLPNAKPRDTLEVIRLHEILPQVLSIKDMTFIKEPSLALKAARQSRRALACFLPAIPSQHICSIAFGGEILPQKSTYFLPKPQSGLLLRLI
jgi:uncharacterized protein (DUF1015 family)